MFGILDENHDGRLTYAEWVDAFAKVDENGDGCSAQCSIEDGYKCIESGDCLVSTCDLNAVPIWGSKEYRHCHFEWTWKELRQHFKANFFGTMPQFRTGSLAEHMSEGRYEVWVCMQDHYCSDAANKWFCWVYDEVAGAFVPWAPNSILQIIH